MDEPIPIPVHVTVTPEAPEAYFVSYAFRFNYQQTDKLRFGCEVTTDHPFVWFKKRQRDSHDEYVLLSWQPLSKADMEMHKAAQKITKY